MPDRRQQMATAFIPAKSVSRRISSKNVIELGGKPLIWWTLEACKRWEAIDEIYVATDSEGISEYAVMQGAKIYPLEQRDIDDQRTASQLWKEFCKGRSGSQIKLYITNPFRTISQMNYAWKMHKSGLYDLILSVKEERHMIYNHECRPLIDFDKRMTRLTQHSKPNYIADGSFYIADAEYVVNCSYYEQGKVLPVPVGSIGGIEIDDKNDLMLARMVANSMNWWEDQDKGILQS